MKQVCFFCRIEKGPYWRQLRSTLAHEHDLHFMRNFVILSNFENSKLGWHCVATLLKLRSAADIPSLASALSEGESSHFQEAFDEFSSFFPDFFSSFHHFFRYCMAYCRKIAQNSCSSCPTDNTIENRPVDWTQQVGMPNPLKSEKPWFFLVFRGVQVEKLISTGWKFSASPWFSLLNLQVCLSSACPIPRIMPEGYVRHSDKIMKSWSHEVSRSVFVPFRARPSRGTAASYVLRVMSLGLDHSFEVSRDITFKCF